MNQPEYDGKGEGSAEEQPLDPATLKVQAKLKRLLAGSSLVMATGFIAVFAAIFYKINSSDSDAGNAIIPESIAIGPGVIVEDMELVEGRLLMLIREGEAAALLHIDPTTGEQLGRTNLTIR